MTAFTATGFPIVLLFLAGLNYFGIRRSKAPMSILATVSMLILAAWGGIYLLDLARFWSGRPREVHAIGIEAFPALALTVVKLRSWLHA